MSKNQETDGQNFTIIKKNYTITIYIVSQDNRTPSILKTTKETKKSFSKLY